MRCDEARAELSARFDGELGGEAAAAVDDHVSGCRACAADLRRLQAVRQHLRFAVVESMPDVAPAVLDAVGSPTRRRRWPDRRLLAPVAAAFVAGAVARAVG